MSSLLKEMSVYLMNLFKALEDREEQSSSAQLADTSGSERKQKKKNKDKKKVRQKRQIKKLSTCFHDKYLDKYKFIL